MPHEEVARVVDGQGLVDVRGDVVVEARLCTGGDISRGASWLALEALDGGNVRLALLLGETPPVQC